MTARRWWAIIPIVCLVGASVTLSGQPVSAGKDRASVSDFLGTWVNSDPKGTLTRLDVAARDASTLSVHAYARCKPMDCDWGTANVPFTPPTIEATFTIPHVNVSYQLAFQRTGTTLDVNLKASGAYPFTEHATLNPNPALLFAAPVATPPPPTAVVTTGTLPYVTAAVVPSTTKLLAVSDMSQLVSPSEGGALDVTSPDLMLTFTAPTTTLRALQPGDTLVSGVTDQTPHGMLRTVRSVSVSADRMTVDTVPDMLRRAVTQGSFSFHDDVLGVRGCATLRHTRLDTAAGQPESTDSSIEASGSICLAPGFDFTVGWGQDGHLHLAGTVRGEESLQLQIVAQGSLPSEIVNTVPLDGGLDLPPISTTFTGSDIPVVVIPHVSFSATVDASFSAGATLGVNEEASFSESVQCTDGDCTAVNTGTPVYHGPAPFSVPTGADATVSFSANPRLDLQLYDEPGPAFVGSIFAHGSTVVVPHGHSLHAGMEDHIVVSGGPLDLAVDVTARATEEGLDLYFSSLAQKPEDAIRERFTQGPDPWASLSPEDQVTTYVGDCTGITLQPQQFCSSRMWGCQAPLLCIPGVADAAYALVPYNRVFTTYWYLGYMSTSSENTPTPPSENIPGFWVYLSPAPCSAITVVGGMSLQDCLAQNAPGFDSKFWSPRTATVRSRTYMATRPS